MDLNYTAQDQEYRKTVRAWLKENIPGHRLETQDQRKQWHRTLYDAGFIGMDWPKEYGGREARPVEQAIVSEELARAKAPTGVKELGISIVGPTLIHHGTDEQKERFLRTMLTGEEVWCQLYSEPNAGSDLASLRCRADREGDTFVINGQKVWTSGAEFADWGLMLARTDRSAPKHLGISCILIDMRAEGIEIRPLRQMTGSSEFSEVFFTDVRVPVSNLVGEMNAGWQIAQTTLSYERGGNMLRRVAHLQSDFTRLMDLSREVQRDGKPLIEEPRMRARMGQIYSEIEVLRYASLRLLSKLEQGERPGPEASVSKLHYSELEVQVQELFAEILGPYARLSDAEHGDFHMNYSDIGDGDDGTWAFKLMFSRSGIIYSGSSQIQKNVIGERVLGLPKEIRADRLDRSS